MTYFFKGTTAIGSVGSKPGVPLGGGSIHGSLYQTKVWWLVLTRATAKQGANERGRGLMGTKEQVQTEWICSLPALPPVGAIDINFILEGVKDGDGCSRSLVDALEVGLGEHMQGTTQVDAKHVVLWETHLHMLVKHGTVPFTISLAFGEKQVGYMCT
jgi:hypothetical protein